MTAIVPQKPCSKCGEMKPATCEFFHSRKDTKDGLRKECKACRALSRKNHYQENREQIIERVGEYQRKNRDKRRVYEREYSRQWREKHPERYRERRLKWIKNNQPRIQARNREWRKRNRERIYVLRRLWIERNKEHVTTVSRKYMREHYRDNIEKYRQKAHLRKQRNPDVFVIYSQRRAARKRALPDTLTPSQWEACLKYFKGCCAVCGRPKGLWHTLATDHWIPLSRGGPTTAENIIPLCHALKDGEGGCNNSKAAKDPIKWLNETFGKVKADAIAKRIHAYFEWVSAQLS